jgi:hypothetical protein
MAHVTKANVTAPTRSGVRDLLPLLGVAVAVAFLYVLPFAGRRLLLPPGDDAIYWVSAMRITSRFGLLGPQLAARPVFPLAGSVIGTMSGASAWVVTAAAPIAFAAGTGLAGAAVAYRWGLRGWRLALFAFLTGMSGVVARLVAGKDENLMALWLMAAAMAVPDWSAWDRGERAPRAGLVAAGVFVAVMTLVEWPLAAIFAGVAAGAWVVIVLVVRTDEAPDVVAPTVKAVRGLAIAALAGVAAGALVIVAIDHVGPGSGIQNLPPDFRYAGRLRIEIALTQPWLTGTLTVLGVIAAWGRERRPPALSVVMLLWLIGTGFTLALGRLGIPGPTYRALTVALPVALATAAAVFLPLLPRRGRSARPATGRMWARGAIAVVLAAGVLTPGMWFLWRGALGTLTSTQQVSEVTAAVRYAQALPGHGPVVLVVGRSKLPFNDSLLYQRMTAAVAPPNTNGGVLIFVGNASDALAGRPSLRRSAVMNPIIRELFAPLRSALAAGAPVLSGRDLDPVGYADALRAGAPTVGGGILAVARGPRPGPGLQQTIAVVPLPHWWSLFVVAVEMLALFLLAGIGWTSVAMPWAATEVRWLVAPAFGAVALAVVSFVLVHLGVRPSGWGAWLSIAIILGGSLAAGRWGVSRGEKAPEVSEDLPVAPSPLR